MIRFLINIAEITFILHWLYRGVRFLLSPKRRRKSIVGKIMLLISRNIHHRLDERIRQQKKSFAMEEQNSKVVKLPKTRIR